MIDQDYIRTTHLILIRTNEQNKKYFNFILSNFGSPFKINQKRYLI